MTKISKSPDRHTFQKNRYIERQAQDGKPVSQDYLKMFETLASKDLVKFDDPESRKNNMEYDLLTTEWILEKVRTNDSYAQNLYAAMCNNEFVRNETWPLLRMDPVKDFWSCSWRFAGGIIADMREKGDYIDWYCSGMRGGDEPDVYLRESDPRETKSVPEGCITDEILEDLERLGWRPVPGGDWDNFSKDY